MARPSGGAWPRRRLQDSAETALDWFDLISSLLSIVGMLDGVEEFEDLAKAAEALASSTPVAGALAEGNYDGSSGNDLQVQADQIANEIQAQAKNAEDGWDQIRTIILSDPDKLAEVGTYAFCDAATNGCGAGNAYAEYALSNNAQQMNTSLARRSIDQVLYAKLVPLAYPVWDTGESGFTNLDRFYFCGANVNNPFESDPPEAAYTYELRSIDPAAPGVMVTDGRNANRWAVYLLVARSRLTYGFPDNDSILTRMYGPLSPTIEDPTTAGLGLRAVDVLPNSPSRFDIPSSEECGWES